MKYHTALDVSPRSVSICIIDDDEGNIQFESKVSSDVDKIVSCLKRFSPDVTSVGFEVPHKISKLVEIVDGWLDIDFTPVGEHPKLSGIEIATTH